MTLPLIPAQPEPEVVRVMRSYQEALARREAAQFREMARRWSGVESALLGDIYALGFEIEQLRAAGETVSQGKLLEMERYQSLLRQLRTGLKEYSAFASDNISTEQAQYGVLGFEGATQALGSRGITAGFDMLPTTALNNMIGNAGDGSPLNKLLKNAWPIASQGLTNALIQAIALGWNPYRTAREASAGLAGGLERFLLIARTEQLRVYREATRMQYQASGVVAGYRRLAARSLRTCIACLVADGRFYPLDTPFEEHPRGRCTQVPVLFGEEGAPPGWQLGRDWFEGLGESDQRTILGPKFYAAWRSGLFSLDQIVKRHDDPTWGASLGVRPLSELLG